MNCNINENDVFNVTIIENDNIQCSLEDEKNVNSSVIARGPRGAKGDPGEPGRDGISPEAEVTRETGKAVLTVTDARGTTTTDIYDGQNGADGADGQDGFSPSASVVKSGDTATITITDKDGTTTASITDGQDGADGEPGEAATIEVGTVTTVGYDQPAKVTNVGTDEEAIFNFEIPRGVPGSSAGIEAGAAIDVTGDVISVKYDNNTLKVNAQNQLYADLTGKQDVISDLATIRSGASAGATAIQPNDNVSELTNDAGYITSSYHDSTKQNVTDNNLQTTSKTIVGAINEVNAKPSVTSLSALTDVELTTLADGEILKYDEATEKWVNGEIQSSAGMVCGQTIFSLDPITNAGLHLLDGTVLPVGGSYDDFITNYIIPLYTAHPERFKTEAEWQAIYAEYGVCGYYVYTAGTSVRLPKVTGKVEGTVDVNALGSVVPESLPNIKGRGYRATQWGGTSTSTGSFNTISTGQGNILGGGSTYSYVNELNFDASRSSSTYQDNAPVKEQAIKGYYYIVVSTVTKTDIEVDIDQIQTDLNNKVDLDLTNMNPSQTVKNTIVGWGMPDYANGISVQSANSSANAYTAPCDGFINCAYLTTSTSGLPYIDNGTIGSYNQSNIEVTVSFFISKGQKFYCTGIVSTQHGTMSNVFYPLKGAS